MDIHLHTPHIKTNGSRMEAEVSRALARFADRLTRVELFLSDTNAGKGGVDQRCVLEARPRGLDPVAVEHEATDQFGAVSGAAGKLERLLAHRFGRLEER